MKRVSILAGMVLAIGFAISAQSQSTVGLTGTVKDSVSQHSIAGAKVKLALSLDSTVTDSSGAYLLTDQNSVLPGQIKNSLFKTPLFNHGTLYFGVANTGERVRIDLYSLSGRHVASLVDAGLDQGNYQINPFIQNLGSQIYLVRFQNGSQTVTFREPWLNSRSAASDHALRMIGSNKVLPGLAKSKSVQDTLIVSAAGYATARTMITSFTGTNDFLLVGASHTGSIFFDNGSYQGCQYPIVITVVDTDLTDASVMVKVTSTTDQQGFMMPLQSVAGQVGTYADSLFININNSDSVKHVIKVLDRDIVSAYYADANPAVLDSTWVMWNGTVGTVDPGASQYFGLVNKLSINAYDPDITDSTLTVLVTSDKDKTGINAKLHPIKFSPGGFTGKVRFTFGPSQGDSVLSVMGTVDDHITLTYHDLTPPADIKGSICTWIPSLASIFLDSAGYHGTSDKMSISFSDDDILDSTVIVNVKSKKDATGISDTLKVSTGYSRTFTGQVGFTTGISAPGFIAVSGSDSVSVSYQDDSPIQLVKAAAAWSSTKK
jgi:hypothetical protein